MTEQYYTLTNLTEERGWTDSRVRNLLGEPDTTRPNPHYKSRPPTKLFLRERVLAVEQWTALAAQAERRRAGSQKAVETKTARLLTYVNGLDVQVPVLPMLELIQSACESYNAYKEEQAFRTGFYDWQRATPGLDTAFLDRITVNYLRHELSHYEVELTRIFGKVGKEEAYVHLNSKVYAAIAALYPKLASECERQAERKGGWGAMDRASEGDPSRRGDE